MAPKDRRGPLPRQSKLSLYGTPSKDKCCMHKFSAALKAGPLHSMNMTVFYGISPCNVSDQHLVIISTVEGGESKMQLHCIQRQ